MTDKEYKILRDRIVEGMKISGKLLVEKKRKLGQKLIISENGIITEIDAADIK